MQKRGLSQVVTTVLIILLVLVAVLIIWGFVRPTIESTGEQVTADCLLIDLEAVNCDGVDTVTVKRGADSGDLTGVRFVFSGGSTDDGVADNLILPPLGQADITGVNVVGGETVNVAAIVGSSGQVCPVSVKAPFLC